jgi:hypothetical protein
MKVPQWSLLIVPTIAFVIGFSMNAVCVAWNGGQMPVLAPNCTSEFFKGEDVQIHNCMAAAAHLKILGDWILLRGRGWCSPGDLLEWFAEYTFWPGIYAWFASRFTQDGIIK